MNRFGLAALAVFVWALKFVFWLPMLTIYLADGRIEKREHERFVMIAVIAWFLVTFLPMFKFDLPEVPWVNIVIFDAFFHYCLGLMILLKMDEERVLKQAA